SLGAGCRWRDRFSMHEDVGIGEVPAHRHRLSRHQRNQSWDCDLAINRREKSTPRAETRILLNNSATQIAINREICIARRFARHIDRSEKIAGLIALAPI